MDIGNYQNESKNRIVKLETLSQFSFLFWRGEEFPTARKAMLLDGSLASLEDLVL